MKKTKKITCPKCASTKSVARYSKRVRTGIDRRRQCSDCSHWFMTSQVIGHAEELKPRKLKKASSKLPPSAELLKKIASGEITVESSAKLLGCSPSSINRAINKSKGFYTVQCLKAFLSKSMDSAEDVTNAVKKLDHAIKDIEQLKFKGK